MPKIKEIEGGGRGACISGLSVLQKVTLEETVFCPWFMIAQLLCLKYLSGVSSLQMEVHKWASLVTNQTVY